MADPNDLSKPLRTFSHLAKLKRRPSEYEIVSTNLLWSKSDPKAPWAMSPSVPLSQWYIKYRNESPLTHDDWDAYDRTMREERRTAVLVTPTRTYTNPS